MANMDGRSRLQLCIFLSVHSFLLWSSVAAETSDLSQEEELALEKQLKSLNKPYVRTFKDEYGITYDCVDMYKQLAFDHPLLKNHTLQLTFQGLPQYIVEKSSSVSKFPKRCPKGTVLIRRTTKEDLIRAKQNLIRRTTKEDLIRAKQNKHSKRIIQPTLNPGTGDGNHYAIVSIEANRDLKFYGASAISDVFPLFAVSNTQASTSQMILTKGERGNPDYFNTIQAGWQVDFTDEGDSLTHFVIYWTSDGFQKTGCMNLRCSGFVQTSASITPGMVLNDRNLPLTILRDASTLNWLLIHNDGSNVIGYWPKEIFNNMADVTQVQLGGFAYSPLTEPSPPMGHGNINGARFHYIYLLDGDRNSIGVPLNTPTTIQDLDRPYYDTDYDYKSPAVLNYGGPGGWVR